jgi:NTE family protein
VLGGGGHLGACQVGMLAALLERRIKPELIVGTSIGAINGAVIAANPTRRAVASLRRIWISLDAAGLLGGGVWHRLGTLARTRTHLHSNQSLRRVLEDALDGTRIEDLAVPFQCVAASIERAAEHWFAEGPVVDAVLASSAVPGLLPPLRIGGEHFVDGGIVNSVPVERAVRLGARSIFVLEVGRRDSPLEPPRWPWEVGLVAFEIARRHRFHRDLQAVPEGVAVHVLPTGVERPPRYNDWAQLRYRDFSEIETRIDRARQASLRFLDALPSD